MGKKKTKKMPRKKIAVKKKVVKKTAKIKVVKREKLDLKDLTPFEQEIERMIIRCEAPGYPRGYAETEEVDADGIKHTIKYGNKVYALACYKHGKGEFSFKEASNHPFYQENCVGCKHWLEQVKKQIFPKSERKRRSLL